LCAHSQTFSRVKQRAFGLFRIVVLNTVGKLRLADMDASDEAGPNEELNWLTELCRAEGAGVEPLDSDDDWLTELRRAPASHVSNGREGATDLGNAFTANGQDPLRFCSADGVDATSRGAGHCFRKELTGSGSNSSVTGLTGAPSRNP